MARTEVQGIVSYQDGIPRVQIRHLDDNDKVEHQLQLEITDARELAQTINEATFNAVYEASLVAMIKERDPKDWEEIAGGMLTMIRRYRMDHWGIPNMPEDWRPTEG